MGRSDNQQSNASINEQTREEYVEERMKDHSNFYKEIYHNLYTINDFTLGLWFFIGSIFFYFEPLKHWGVTLFVVASFQFILKPTIRLVHEFKAKEHYKNQYDEQQHS
ncbi:YrhK family protein [Thalassobacillus pellis]|uniref:YrhK family protein n=1 Tax=Thalassobacillus pellis TaxID=748008 RepID=UPI0019618F6E|nr:YrhK family protein [Thalassobacillus pellis]MBM7552114.1 hypothetical protein [Thalassobacillus pellis]